MRFKNAIIVLGKNLKERRNTFLLEKIPFNFRSFREVVLRTISCQLIYYYPSAKLQYHVAWNYPISSQLEGYF